MNKGFTLIEVLVASLILCLFITSFSLLVGTGIKQTSKATQMTRAMLLCKSVLEELRSKPYETLYLYDNETFDAGSGRITVTPQGPDLLRINIQHKVDISTLRSRYK